MTRRGEMLAGAIAAIERATDEAAVLHEVMTFLERLGLNAHVAMLEAGGAGLVVQAITLPWSAVAQLDRILGRPIVGARIPLGPTSPYQAVVRDRQAIRNDAPIWCVRLAVPGMSDDEAAAMAEVIRLCQAILAPIVADRDLLGVLTVWGGELSDADVTTVEHLALVVGTALAGHRPRTDNRPLAAA